MTTSPTWLNLTDLGNIYGISPIKCGRTLEENGWRDQHGRPTQGALLAGAVSTEKTQKLTDTTLWHADICKALLERNGFIPVSRASRIAQWTQLLEALEEGSPSINTTAEQMAEELPKELIQEVNAQLAERGCHFRVKDNSRTHASTSKANNSYCL